MGRTAPVAHDWQVRLFGRHARVRRGADGRRTRIGYRGRSTVPSRGGIRVTHSWNRLSAVPPVGKPLPLRRALPGHALRSVAGSPEGRTDDSVVGKLVKELEFKSATDGFWFLQHVDGPNRDCTGTPLPIPCHIYPPPGRVNYPSDGAVFSASSKPPPRAVSKPPLTQNRQSSPRREGQK